MMKVTIGGFIIAATIATRVVKVGINVNLPMRFGREIVTVAITVKAKAIIVLGIVFG